MDTRRHRSDILADAKEEHPTMLGEKQIAALHTWLGKVGTLKNNLYDVTESYIVFRSIRQPHSNSSFHPFHSRLYGVTKANGTHGLVSLRKKKRY